MKWRSCASNCSLMRPTRLLTATRPFAPLSDKHSLVVAGLMCVPTGCRHRLPATHGHHRRVCNHRSSRQHPWPRAQSPVLWRQRTWTLRALVAASHANSISTSPPFKQSGRGQSIGPPTSVEGLWRTVTNIRPALDIAKESYSRNVRVTDLTCPTQRARSESEPAGRVPVSYTHLTLPTKRIV